MKLYKRSDFILLPKNTIYSKVNHELMEGLYCKVSSHEELTNDFCEQDLIGEYGFPNNIADGFDASQYQINLRDTFQDFRTDLDCSCRDGLYDDSDIFVVWDRLDIQKLHDYLSSVLVSPEQIDIDFLIEKHPGITRQDAFDLMKFASENTVQLKSCYGDGSTIYPMWLKYKVKK